MNPKISYRRFGFQLTGIGLLMAGILILASCAPQVPRGRLVRRECLDCHEKKKAEFARRYVHNPVKAEKCEACNERHGLVGVLRLREGEPKLCYSCHQKEEKAFQRKAMHTPVRNGQCLSCHDPHASKDRFQLARTGSTLCLSCHEKLQKVMAKAFVHLPFKEGQCLSCHDPHASDQKAQLIAMPHSLCQNCHDLKASKIKAAHQKIPIGKAACATCHDPHASGSKGLVRAYSHAPFAQKMCDGCHDVGGKDPLKTIAQGPRLCYTCHGDKEKEFRKGLVHTPVVGGECTTCHSPHATDEKFFLVEEERDLCLSCHNKVGERLAGSKFIHPVKVENGRCTICHSPHASDVAYLFPKPSIAMCSTCHPSQGSFTHPVGEKVIDPRDQKSQVTCISCHGPHGTPYPRILRLSRERELCVQCHVKVGG